MENAQTGLPSWAAALAEQLHASFAAQMSRIRAEQEGVPRERTCRPCRESAVAGPTERDRGPAGARATAGSWRRAAHDGRGCRAIDGASGLGRSVNMSVPPGVTGVRAPSPTGVSGIPAAIRGLSRSGVEQPMTDGAAGQSMEQTGSVDRSTCRCLRG